MKRLILMGGRPWFAEDGGKRFVETLFRYYPKEVKLAFCIFAQPESEWDETRGLNTEMFKRFAGERKITYQTMTQENFAAVSRWAGIIYLPGGSTSVLMERAKSFDVTKLWEGKLVAGSSAGMSFMCEGYVGLGSKKYGRGLGWVRATAIPHWRSDYNGFTDADWDHIEREALKHAPDTPVLCVPEDGFVEFIVK